MRREMTKFQKKLWIGLAILALLTPLGIIIPHIYGAGGSWGEWGPSELGKLAGFVPEGFKKLSGLWKAPARNYNFGATSMAGRLASYIVSGIIGLLVAGLLIYLIARITIRHGRHGK